MTDITETTFDYGQLDLETDAFVRERVEKIKGLGNRASRCIVDIGRYLTEVKARTRAWPLAALAQGRICLE